MRRSHIVAARRARTRYATASAPPENHGGTVTTGQAPGTERCRSIPQKEFLTGHQYAGTGHGTHGTRCSVAAVGDIFSSGDKSVKGIYYVIRNIGALSLLTRPHRSCTDEQSVVQAPWHCRTDGVLSRRYNSDQLIQCCTKSQNQNIMSI